MLVIFSNENEENKIATNMYYVLNQESTKVNGRQKSHCTLIKTNSYRYNFFSNSVIFE